MTGAKMNRKPRKGKVLFAAGLAVLGLQETADQPGKLQSAAFASGKFRHAPAQSDEAQERMADVLWWLARLCKEAGISLGDLAARLSGVPSRRWSAICPNSQHFAKPRRAEKPFQIQ